MMYRLTQIYNSTITFTSSIMIILVYLPLFTFYIQYFSIDVFISFILLIIHLLFFNMFRGYTLNLKEKVMHKEYIWVIIQASGVLFLIFFFQIRNGAIIPIIFAVAGLLIDIISYTVMVFLNAKWPQERPNSRMVYVISFPIAVILAFFELVLVLSLIYEYLGIFD